MARAASLAGILALGASSAACGDDSPTTPTPTQRSSPATDTFASNLTTKGASWRFINAIQGGTVTATLTETDQPSTVIGLAIGLRSGTSGCLVTRETVGLAGSSPQISATVDAGDYCVMVFDTGAVTTPMAFTLSITYP